MATANFTHSRHKTITIMYMYYKAGQYMSYLGSSPYSHYFMTVKCSAFSLSVDQWFSISVPGTTSGP